MVPFLIAGHILSDRMKDSESVRGRVGGRGKEEGEGKKWEMTLHVYCVRVIDTCLKYYVCTGVGVLSSVI